MAVAAFVLSLCALIVSLGAMVAAIMSVRFARSVRERREPLG